MKEFLLIFRTGYSTVPQPSPEELKARTERWMAWAGKLAAQNKLAARGNRLLPTGKVVKDGGIVTDGPYIEIKECIVGYSVVNASTLDEAVELVRDCPVYESGGNVEVREIHPL